MYTIFFYHGTPKKEKTYFASLAACLQTSAKHLCNRWHRLFRQKLCRFPFRAVCKNIQSIKKSKKGCPVLLVQRIFRKHGQQHDYHKN